MMVIKLVLFALVIANVEGLGKIWKFRDSSVNERTMKAILESCYENDSSSDPILIIGNFNEYIDKSSIIRINDFREFQKNSDNHQLLLHRPSTIVLIPDSPEKLDSDLETLAETEWWDHMAQFFIIEKSNETCRNFKKILVKTWKRDIINSLYICAVSMNTSALYTLNPIANYAPYPWKRKENLDHLNVFHQVFDPNTSCNNLNYDKTKFLDGHKITAVACVYSGRKWKPGRNYYHRALEELPVESFNAKVLQCIIRALNATGRFEIEVGENSYQDRIYNRTADVTMDTSTLDSMRTWSSVFPHRKSLMVAVIRLSPEVTTPQKILKLWSTPVLIVAAVAFLLFFLTLTVKNHSFFLAMLDVVRLLTYTSIRTNARSHAFRIYFTTLLILMIISNGVFRGKIAVFLSKQERGDGIKTIDKLVQLKYQMYTSGSKGYANANCPQCDFKEVTRKKCIEYVLNSTLNVCGISKQDYDTHYNLLPLEYVEEPLNKGLENFKCRKNWPLHDRVDYMFMRLVESGIIDYWKMRATDQPRRKRRAMEAEWSSARYKPVKLYKLKFAFQGLACGLLLATIVFFLEIWWADY